MIANDSQLQEFLGIFHKGSTLTYKKGEYIIRPGESPNGVFYIQEGLVKAFNISKYGEENLLIIRTEHEVFPLIWAVTGQDRDIIYQALAPTTVYRIGRKQFETFLHDNPSSLPPMLDLITEQYRRHSERLLTLEYRTVRERLISFLISMADRFGKHTKNGLYIDVPLRHQDIASSINASRETTSRELAYLERKGYVSNSAFYITLKDIQSLRDYL